MADFVHLHVHSDYSLADAAVSVNSLAERAANLGMKHLALTDHGNMFGAMEFIKACEKNSIKPIIGCEMYVSPGSRHEKKGSENENRYYHLVLLAASRQGYHNLVKLCSFAYTEGFYYRPRIDEELLSQYSKGLIALSACASGEIPRHILSGKADEAMEKALHYKKLFGNDENGEPNFYLEIQSNNIPRGVLRGDLSQAELNRAIIDISTKTDIPLVATNDVHYLEREDYIVHDILLCIGTGKVRTEERRKKYHGNEFFLKSIDEMAALFPDCPQAISNTISIAKRCNPDIPKITTQDLPKFLPEFKIPLGFENTDDYIKSLALKGLEKRYSKEKAEAGVKWQEILTRFEFELETIIQMGFTGYFLIVADFINWARENNIPVGPGRGSGAGSIAAYALRITDIDPLKYNLLFERFLNPERISMPDFDIDFANEGRDEVIKYVTEKYGRERVSQIITFGTFGAKAAIKDVARVLEISIPESEMITKLIPKDPKITLEKAIKAESRLQELELDTRYTELFPLAKKLEGLNRHSSIHASGVVIGNSSLHDFVPLFRDTKTGAIATQYDMNHLEASGLVKMDFLGLKTLDVIKHTEELVRQRGGEYANFSIEKIPEDSRAVFDMLGEGKSSGVFQFESEGMQDVIKRAKPSSIEDLIALNSLYRPGPMDNIDQFINSKNGSQEIVYPDPSLKDVLEETYGVIVYQEQVMQVAQIIAGYSMGQADLLRRAMGKKIKEIIDKEKIPFIDGALKKGFPKTRAAEIFDILVPFAGYGFNKSHAAAYSVIAYQTAYLKANFPAEFMAAILTNEINSADKDKLSESIAEARRMGLEIVAPDINLSRKLFTVADKRIVYGLLGLKGVGEGPAEEIEKSRENRAYRDFSDFLERVDIKAVGKSVIERLILTGAFDSFGIKRENLKGNLERIIEHTQKIKDEKNSGQTSLFGDAEDKEFSEFVFEDFPEMSREEKLKTEKDLMGFYLSGHPLDDFKELWKRMVKCDLGNPQSFKTGDCILIGIIKNIKTHIGKAGKMAFVSLEDYNGEIDMLFFSQVWEKCERMIEADKVVIIKGKIEYQKDRDRYNFLAEDIINENEAEILIEKQKAFNLAMEEYKAAWENTVRVNLANPEEAQADIDYTLIGTLKDLKPFRTKKGNDMAYAALSDYNGEIPVTIFSQAWADMQGQLEENKITALRGKIQKDQFKNRMIFSAETLLDVKKINATAAKAINDKDRELHVLLSRTAAENNDELMAMRNILKQNPGSSSVFIHIPVPQGETLIRSKELVNIAKTAQALNHCTGIAKIWEE